MTRVRFFHKLNCNLRCTRGHLHWSPTPRSWRGKHCDVYVPTPGGDRRRCGRKLEVIK